jgi:hypothetical protein
MMVMRREGDNRDIIVRMIMTMTIIRLRWESKLEDIKAVSYMIDAIGEWAQT